MNILIAIDSFKGSLSSVEANHAVKDGIWEVDKEVNIITVPLADGGEGTVEALVKGTNGNFVKTNVTGPIGNRVEATYGILGEGRTAVIEVAEACGLPLIAEQDRNPLKATTCGVGELILDALEKGCREFVIGLGGSATNDAGVGMLQTLGFSFLNHEGKEIGVGGIELQHLCKIDASNVHPMLKNCTFRIACDVNNPLYGPNGASAIYAPQKGATPKMVEQLDNCLKNFADVVLSEKGIDLQDIPGSGAAGGLGAAFAAFLNGSIQSGVQLVLEMIGMEEKVAKVDFVITGEGKLDGQTSMGKAPLGVAELARKFYIPTIALAGGISKEAENLNALGITAFFSVVTGPMSLAEAMDPQTAYQNIRITSKQIFQLMQVRAAVQGDGSCGFAYGLSQTQDSR
jgi:glycerate 2-kinase